MYISEMPLRGRHIWIVLVASMEQIIGTALSTVVGVMIPMINLIVHPQLSSSIQGLIGAIGLIGIGVGSMTIGKLADREGYLQWFRICPALILLSSIFIWLFPQVPCLIIGLFMMGIGIGGGYSLDSAYISELLPEKWKGFMVGVAKSSCALGFIGMALVCWFILSRDPSPHLWNVLILLIGLMGLIALLMRIAWWQSPVWLMSKGESAKAQKDAQRFLGKGAQVKPVKEECMVKIPFSSFFKGENIKKVIFSGIPWACEGLGVYGIGVFLPILCMALGIESATAHGMHKVTQSVLTTTYINIFILLGFVAGLAVVRKWNNTKMLYQGFLICSIGLAILICAHVLKWPVWTMIVGFMIFEIFLNAGPHLITYIIPTQVYTVDERATGSGIAAFLGKLGAIIGVFFMPVLLEIGGMTLVLSVSLATMLTGALVAYIFGKQLKLF